MKIRSVIFLLVCAILSIASSAAAQVSVTGTINGTVTDTSDAVVPGASVRLKDEGTGVTKDTVTNAAGAFAFRDLSFGNYEVTVTLQGFRTALYRKVIVESGRTTDLRVKLAPGGVEQSVTVEGSSPVLEMTSNVISSTLNNKAITELPLAGRNAFTFARLVPGAVAPQGTGSTHYNGMPGGTINPTIDGVNNSSNGFKSGGTSFFGTVPARLGAVEEVTVETAGLGGDAGVTGGVNLKFVTRRGTNAYRASGFEQYRTEKLNANSYNNSSRNLPKAELRRHDFGGNLGGPILRDKLFFFANYEQEYIPQTTTQSLTILQPEAQQGIFRYQTASGEQRTADLLSIAAANGFKSTPDPVISSMLGQQALARANGTVTTTNNLRTESLQWLEPQKQINYYPTARVDFQVRNNLALMSSYNRYNQDAKGRRVWPISGYPIQLNTFDAGWWVWANGLNWSLSTNAHNELRVGIQHSGDSNARGREAEHFKLNGIVNGLPARFGTANGPSLPLGLTPLAGDNSPVIGAHYITTISDTLTFLRGNHTLGLGGNYRDTQWRDRSLSGSGTAGYLGLPRYSIGSPAGDPVQSIFTDATMPGIQTADLATVYALYALLTGRLAAVQTGKVVDPATGQYSDEVYFENWTSAWFGGVFAQDKWRLTPHLTLNYGVRWEALQAPYNHTNTAVFPDYANLLGPSTRLFAPGELNGIADPVLRRGKYATKADWNNFAPKLGFAWTPNFDGGLLARVFGKGDETVFRGGYDVTYFDEGTNMFASTAGNNPGQSQSLLLTPGAPGFTAGGLTLQSPLPPFVAQPAAYKDVWNQSELTFGTTGIKTMKDDLKTGYVQSWNVGVQRLLMKNTVLELRYVGNRGSNLWHAFDSNEVNIFENGFLDEFRRAQQNLAINVANGLTGFANNNLPGQQALPIFSAAFGARGGQPALSGNQGFTNGGFITNLQQGEAGRLAASLSGNQTYICRMVGNAFSPCASRGYSAPGPYPSNVFVVNPFAIGGALTTVDDDGYSKYHGMQLQLRRRYTNGLSMNVNYTLAKNWTNIWADNATQGGNFRTLRDRSLDASVAPFDVRHVLQTFGTYDLPFGKERHWKIGNPILNAMAGGWTLGGIVTAQSGTPFRLSSGRLTVNGQDSGVLLMNGHTVDEIQSMIHISPGPGFNRYWIDPKLIGPDGRANPEYLAPPTTPGEFGSFVYLRGNNVWNIDASLNKTTALIGRTSMTIHFTVQNLLNHPVFSTPGFLGDTSIQSTTFGQSGNPINGARNLYARLEFRF
ncbi:MAG: carboxypeptidase-like regulatory domain-containing protein [Vicinamibacterales bacterium]